MNLKQIFLTIASVTAAAAGPLAAADPAKSDPLKESAATAGATAYKGRVDPSAFPARERDKQGTVADPAAVRLITLGVDKFSIYRLIGPPQYGEGIARRWNYLLRFPVSPGSAERVACRMEIRFERKPGKYNVVVSDVIWKDQACADRVANGG